MLLGRLVSLLNLSVMGCYNCKKKHIYSLRTTFPMIIRLELSASRSMRRHPMPPTNSLSHHPLPPSYLIPHCLALLLCYPLPPPLRALVPSVMQFSVGSSIALPHPYQVGHHHHTEYIIGGLGHDIIRGDCFALLPFFSPT